MKVRKVRESDRSRRRLRSLGLGGAAVLATITVATGCSSGSKSAATVSTSSKPVSISIGAVGGLAVTQALPVAVALNNGYFTKNGLKVSVVTMSSPATACQSVQSGSVQMAQCATGSYVPIDQHGGHLVQFETYFTTISPYDLMVPKSIKSWSQLAGKTFGLSGSADIPAYMLQTMASKNGLRLGSYHEAVVGSSSARFAALTSGAVQGALLSPPLNLLAEASGFHTLDQSVKYFPSNTFSQSDFVANSSWLNGNARATTAWIKSIAEANAWFANPADKTAVVQFLIKQYALKNAAEADSIYEAYIAGHIISHSLCNSDAGMKATGKALVSLGTISQGQYPTFVKDIPTYAPNTYVEAALHETCTASSD